jgi:hypothetical protein
MEAVRLLDLAQSAGLRVTVDGPHLCITGKKKLEPLAKELLARKPEVFPLVQEREDAVRRRMTAMLPQVPQGGAIPFLVAVPAVPDVAPAPGCCLSCGDPLTTGQRYRCGPCGEAARRVLHQVRES